MVPPPLHPCLLSGYAMMTIIQSASQLEHLQSAGDVERTDHCSEFCGDVLLHRLPAGRTERSVDVVDITWHALVSTTCQTGAVVITQRRSSPLTTKYIVHNNSANFKPQLYNTLSFQWPEMSHNYSTNHPVFTARRYASAIYATAQWPVSVCPSVCLCVCQCSGKTAKRSLTQTTRHNRLSRDSIVFRPNIATKFDRSHLLQGRQVQVVWAKIGDFNSLYPENDKDSFYQTSNLVYRLAIASLSLPIKNRSWKGAWSGSRHSF